MASQAGRRRRAGEQSWLSAMIGVAALVSGGFLLGLVVGVVSEEPELVVGHVAGRSSEIAWASESTSESDPAGAGTATASADDAPGRNSPDRRAVRAAESPPPVAAPPPGLVGVTYTIQVGAFAQSGSAEQVARQLKGKGYPARVLSPAGDDRWRVRVGPLASRGEAEGMARRLKIEERLPTWVLPQPRR